MCDSPAFQIISIKSQVSRRDNDAKFDDFAIADQSLKFDNNEIVSFLQMEQTIAN